MISILDLNDFVVIHSRFHDFHGNMIWSLLASLLFLQLALSDFSCRKAPDSGFLFFGCLFYGFFSDLPNFVKKLIETSPIQPYFTRNRDLNKFLNWEEIMSDFEIMFRHGASVRDDSGMG